MSASAWTDSEMERRRLVETGAPVVANMKRDLALVEWAKETGRFLRIDRRTPLGNPYRMRTEADQDTVCEKYAAHLHATPDLSGKVLGCWCHPLRCHGDALIERWRRSAS